MSMETFQTKFNRFHPIDSHLRKARHGHKSGSHPTHSRAHAQSYEYAPYQRSQSSQRVQTPPATMERWSYRPIHRRRPLASTPAVTGWSLWTLVVLPVLLRLRQRSVRCRVPHSPLLVWFGLVCFVRACVFICLFPTASWCFGKEGRKEGRKEGTRYCTES